MEPKLFIPVPVPVPVPVLVPDPAHIYKFKKDNFPKNLAF